MSVAETSSKDVISAVASATVRTTDMPTVNTSAKNTLGFAKAPADTRVVVAMSVRRISLRQQLCFLWPSTSIWGTGAFRENLEGRPFERL